MIFFFKSICSHLNKAFFTNNCLRYSLDLFFLVFDLPSCLFDHALCIILSLKSVVENRRYSVNSQRSPRLGYFLFRYMHCHLSLDYHIELISMRPYIEKHQLMYNYLAQKVSRSHSCVHTEEPLRFLANLSS